MHNQPDYVGLSLIAAMGITSVIWIVLEARHSDRFRKETLPMSPRIRHWLMWIAFVEIAALTFWETQHGNTLFYQ
jgi:hypothetical protein